MKRNMKAPAKFWPGDKFEFVHIDGTVIKTGVVRSLRDDKWEQTYSDRYHYYVDYDDGTFETCEDEEWMRLIAPTPKPDVKKTADLRASLNQANANFASAAKEVHAQNPAPNDKEKLDDLEKAIKDFAELVASSIDSAMIKKNADQIKKKLDMLMSNIGDQLKPILSAAAVIVSIGLAIADLLLRALIGGLGLFSSNKPLNSNTNTNSFSQKTI